MKEFLKAYFSFNKAERTGIVALVAIIVLLLAMRLFMHRFVKPEINTEQEQRLTRAWEEFKLKNKSTEKTEKSASQQLTPVKAKPVLSNNATTESTLFPFDPNTIDSAGLRKLGLREKTTSIFLHWRAKGKRFYRKEEMRKVYTLTEEEYLRLEPYIVISNNKE